MTRDYSQFMPGAAMGAAKPSPATLLQTLGWQPFFAQQCSVEEIEDSPPVRVTEVHRSGLHVLGEGIDTSIPPGPEAAVGDWLLLDHERPGQSRVLHRKSLFQRRAPGTDRRVQRIAANVDTVFVVTSCNADFNIARLERYVALAFEAEVAPVIVLTKADLCEDVTTFTDEAMGVSDRVPVIALNALGTEPLDKLAPYCGRGQTLAFLGSSGVGKSTLVNALMGGQVADTSGIREDDAKGRHTTTHRQLHLLEQGFTVLDTPGMRELQLADVEDGIATLFDDIATLSAQCRFRDCSHQTEPGCAVLEAVENGTLDAARVARWRKLLAEDRFNSASLAERRAHGKAFQKRINAIVRDKPNRR